jgi:hypothetical protein
MSVLDIKKGYRHISPEELRSAAYSGIVYCGSLDLSDFLEYLFQGMYSEQDLKEAFEEGKKEAQDSEISICSECEEEIYG